MKADHRHELKTNELADWLAHLPEWLKDNRTTLIGATAVIVVAVIVYFWIFYQSNVASARSQARLTNIVTQIPAQKNSIARATAQQADQAYLLLDVARELQDLAATASDGKVAALALIERAETLRAELHYQRGDVSADELAKRMTQAKASYQQALERAPDNPALAATARFGLGLCEEEIGNFDGAKTIYSEVAKDSAYDGTVAQAAAALRLQTIDDSTGLVVFKPAPPPAAQASRPQIEIVPGDANGPTVFQPPGAESIGPTMPIGPMPEPNEAPAVTSPATSEANETTAAPVVPAPAAEAYAPTGG